MNQKKKKKKRKEEKEREKKRERERNNGKCIRMIFDVREDETCFRKCDCDRRAETIQARLEQRIVFYTAAEWLM